MVEKDADYSDVVGQALTTSEHGHLQAVLDAITRLEELRARDLNHEQIAERIRLTHPSRPDGGPWTGAAVARILEIVDSHRSTSAPAAHPPASHPTHRSASPATGQIAATASQRPQPMTRLSHQPHDSSAETSRHHQGRGRGLRPALLAAAATLMVLAGAAAALAWWSDDADLLSALGLSDDGGSTDTSDTSTDTAPTGSDTSQSAADTTDTSAAALADAEQADGDEADMMTIRIEPSSENGDPGAAAPATATIRDDGLLHVEGAFTSDDEAAIFLTRAAEVFGEANIVESFVIDSGAPTGDVTDVALDKPVLFETGSATIHPDYIPFLEACGDVLKFNPQIVMSISGYTDTSGSSELNLELSQQRAEAIVAFYESIDIGAEQLVATGYGEDAPMADNTTVEGRSQNRRAMLQLLNIMGD